MVLFKHIAIFLLISITLLAFACGGDDDDNDDSNPSDDDQVDDDQADDDAVDDDATDDDTTDDDAVDDDLYPSIGQLEPQRWGRYVCPEQAREGFTVVTGNFNIHGGQEGSPEEVGAALAAYGPFDVFSLQECPEEYAEPIAEALGMYYFYSEDQSLMTATPLIDPQKHNYESTGGWGRFLHATTVIDGHEVSVYGMHVDWNDTGDLQNRELVDDYLTVDPADYIVLMGDWNEELGSTQAIILDEVVADAWASNGVCPSCRTTWPAIQFYGAEGQQLIDNTYFNKSSGGCTVDGEIIHLTPNRSDHKPQTTTIFFPETIGFVPPILLDVVYGLGAESIGLLFDKPIADAEIQLFAGETQLEVVDIRTIGDGTMVQVEAAEDLPTDALLTAKVLSATDVDGAQTSQTLTLDFANYENMLVNPGAEFGETGWTFDGAAQVSEINHVVPLVGDSFFSGTPSRPRGWVEQIVPLDEFAEMIDAGYGQLVFGGASATGYRIEEGGTSNILWPHDEGEAVVELLGEQGNLLKHVSGGRHDLMFWMPFRVTDTIPPGTRYAKVVLRLVADEMPWYFNSASFDAMFLSVAALEEPHTLLAGNLLTDPLFLEGKDNWDMTEGTVVGRDHYLPMRSNININTATGEYWVGALLLKPGETIVSQDIPLFGGGELIVEGRLGLEWGAYLRTWNPRSQAALRITFFDGSFCEGDSEVIGPYNIPEWFRYEKVTRVPPYTMYVRFEWIATAEVVLSGVLSFLDAPFVYPMLLDEENE